MTETSVLVQPQKVPGGYVSSTVSSGIGSRISSISQQIMSQTNLERVIQQFGLFYLMIRRDLACWTNSKEKR